jgi:hypothetical protein
MVLESLVFSLLNQLTWLVARKYFTIRCRRESYKSHMTVIVHSLEYTKIPKVFFMPQIGVPLYHTAVIYTLQESLRLSKTRITHDSH